jgi:hypothetical protein
MDLSLKDIQTHARPYPFDQLLFGSSSRITPHYSQAFERAYGIANGGSLTVYAEWFKERLKTWPERIFSMDKNSSIFKPIPGAGLFKKNKAVFQTVPVKGNPRDFCKRAASALRRALENPRFSGTVANELNGLFFPGEKQPSRKDLLFELSGVEARYGNCHE